MILRGKSLRNIGRAASRPDSGVSHLLQDTVGSFGPRRASVVNEKHGGYRGSSPRADARY